MAARRLILALLVLLVLSSAAAALIPTERGGVSDTSTTSTTTQAEEPPPPPTGEALDRRLNADRDRPTTIRMRKGDQLELTVTSSKEGQVEILVLGMLEDVDRFFPARFNLLPVDQGVYPVRLLSPGSAGGEGRLIGRVVVEGRGGAQEGSEKPS